MAQSLLSWRRDLTVNYQLYLLVLLPVAYIFVFMYIPMYGTQIAFREFMAIPGDLGEATGSASSTSRSSSTRPTSCAWCATRWRSASTPLIAGFPFPILLALALNSSLNRRFKKTVQMVTYAPYFISTVVMVGMLFQFLSPRIGFVNDILALLGFERVMFLSEPALFSSRVRVVRGLAAHRLEPRSSTWRRSRPWTRNCTRRRSSDGANRLRRILHIDIPSILPTIVVLLIIQCGQIMTLGFEKVYLMQVPLNLARSEIIATYVYKVGLVSSIPNYSYGAAIGLFNAVDQPAPGPWRSTGCPRPPPGRVSGRRMAKPSITVSTRRPGVLFGQQRLPGAGGGGGPVPADLRGQLLVQLHRRRDLRPRVAVAGGSVAARLRGGVHRTKGSCAATTTHSSTWWSAPP